MSADRHGLAWLAAYGLPGTVLDPPPGPWVADQWSATLRSAVTQGLSGHLVQAIHDGALAVTEQQRDEAVTEHVAVATATLNREKGVLDLLGALAAAGVEVRVLRGPVLAHAVYPDPGLRPYQGFRLVTRVGDLPRAVAVLRSQGCLPLPGDGIGRDRAAVGPDAQLRGPRGLRIDLGHAPAPGLAGLRIPREQLWEPGAVALSVGGMTLTTLDPAKRLLAACYHAVLEASTPLLVGLRDIAQELFTSKPDVAAVRQLGVAWQAEAVVATAVAHTWSILGLADVLALSAWAARHPVGRPDERGLTPRANAVGSGPADTWAAIRAIAGWRGKARALRELALTRPNNRVTYPRHARNVANGSLP